MNTVRKVTESVKKRIAGKQFYTCGNKPHSNLKGLENYLCPLWQKSIKSGSFDESGYEIDHIQEFAISGNDSEDNLQALCKSCHSVKTKRFMNKQSKPKQKDKKKSICIDAEIII